MDIDRPIEKRRNEMKDWQTVFNERQIGIIELHEELRVKAKQKQGNNGILETTEGDQPVAMLLLECLQYAKFANR